MTDFDKPTENSSRLPTNPGTREEFEAAIAPFVESALIRSAQKNPEPLVEILSPVIGRSIRKSIADFFESLTQTLDRALELSLSSQGLKWRWEAWRTKTPFSEIVMLRSLKFEVVRIILIHRESGCPLVTVARESDTNTIGQMDTNSLSGMMSALQDLVGESFAQDSGNGAEDRDNSARTIQIENQVIWTEVTDRLALGVFIVGQAPQGLRTKYRNALDSIDRNFKEAIDNFNGETVPFSSAALILRSLLFSNIPQQTPPPRNKIFTPSRVILSLVGAALLFFGFRWATNQRAMSRLEHALHKTSGWRSVHIARESGKIRVTGERDPYSVTPEEILRRTQLSDQQVQFALSPYLSLEPETMQNRFASVVRPPASLNVRFNGDTNTWLIGGHAPHEWYRIHESKIAAFFGPIAWSSAELRESEAVRLEEWNERLLKLSIPFETGSSDIEPEFDDQLKEIGERFSELSKFAPKMRVVLNSYVDRTGPQSVNEKLARERASVVSNRLKGYGLPSKILKVRVVFPPNGTTDVQKDRYEDRHVTFSVEAPEARAR